MIIVNAPYYDELDVMSLYATDVEPIGLREGRRYSTGALMTSWTESEAW